MFRQRNSLRTSAWKGRLGSERTRSRGTPAMGTRWTQSLAELKLQQRLRVTTVRTRGGLCPLHSPHQTSSQRHILYIHIARRSVGPRTERRERSLMFFCTEVVFDALSGLGCVPCPKGFVTASHPCRVARTTQWRQANLTAVPCCFMLYVTGLAFLPIC